MATCSTTLTGVGDRLRDVHHGREHRGDHRGQRQGARGSDARVIAGRELMNSACSRAPVTPSAGPQRDRRDPVELDPKTTFSNTPQLFLPKQIAAPGVSYTLKFAGYVTANPLVSSTAEFSFW